MERKFNLINNNRYKSRTLEDLYKDLQTLKTQDSSKDHILLNLTFKSNFPFEPPFVRVVYPIIHGECLII